jgi:glycogen operon protein
MRSVVIDPAGYDWEGDMPLNRPIEDAIVYERHVRGFTKSPSSKVRYPGTFAGLIEKIPYLKDLGITAVELLPIFEFDETAPVRTLDGKPLWNFWGYSTMGYFAPHSALCVRPEDGLHLKEFRDAVKALLNAGIEVILDVVFNHTDEGNHQGPTFCFRGIDNRSYYFLVPWAMQYYMDYSESHRRCHARRAAAVVLQWTLRHLVLLAGDGFCQFQRRSRAVSPRRGIATG